MNATWLVVATAVFLLLPCLVRSQGPPEPGGVPAADSPPSAPTVADALPIVQARLADRYKRLEEVLSRLAEYSAATDPRRAKLLREAIAQSREQDIAVRFESIVKLLEDERLSLAANNQAELQQELDGLLNLLLRADRDQELSSERDRVRKYLREVSRLIRMQKGVRARTEGGDELPELSKDQERIAAETGQLGGAISQSPAEQQQPAGDTVPKQSEENESGDVKQRDNKSAEPKDRDAAPSESDSQPADSQHPGADEKPNKSQDAPPKPGESSPEPAQDAETPAAQPQEGKRGESPSEPGKSQNQPGEPSSPQPGQSGQPSPSQGESSPPSDQQPEPSQEPADRAAQRLRAAQQQMDQARKQLEEAERKGAASHQREALRALEQAKAELERILRQIREEELERTLTQLAARFRKMLELQNQVYEATMRLHEVPQAKRDHEDEIEAAKLSRQELQIVNEADKALLLLREEGSSVAFPETVEQMRDDMRQVAGRLAEFKVEEITQGLEHDIIAALEETIAALDKASKDMEKNRTPPGQQPSGGEPPEPPLVDQIAELKMIRSLQMRINLRTQRYGKLIVGEQAETTDLLRSLEQLSDRQERVYQATADLSKKVND